MWTETWEVNKSNYDNDNNKGNTNRVVSENKTGLFFSRIAEFLIHNCTHRKPYNFLLVCTVLALLFSAVARTAGNIFYQFFKLCVVIEFGCLTRRKNNIVSVRGRPVPWSAVTNYADVSWCHRQLQLQLQPFFVSSRIMIRQFLPIRVQTSSSMLIASYVYDRSNIQHSN